MKMNSGIASSTSLVITPKMRCGSAPRMPKSMTPSEVAEEREDQRHAGQRQRHRIAGHQRGDDRDDHEDGEDFGERHQRGLAKRASALIACAMPCSAIRKANSGMSVLSTNTSGRPLVSCERSRIAQERAA